MTKYRVTFELEKFACTLVLSMLVVLVLCEAESACAQSIRASTASSRPPYEADSHRKLAFPEGASNNALTHFRMMRQLQSLMDDSSEDSELELPDGLDLVRLLSGLDPQLAQKLVGNSAGEFNSKGGSGGRQETLEPMIQEILQKLGRQEAISDQHGTGLMRPSVPPPDSPRSGSQARTAPRNSINRNTNRDEVDAPGRLPATLNSSSDTGNSQQLSSARDQLLREILEARAKGEMPQVNQELVKSLGKRLGGTLTPGGANGPRDEQRAELLKALVSQEESLIPQETGGLSNSDATTRSIPRPSAELKQGGNQGAPNSLRQIEKALLDDSLPGLGKGKQDANQAPGLNPQRRGTPNSIKRPNIRSVPEFLQSMKDTPLPRITEAFPELQGIVPSFSKSAKSKDKVSDWMPKNLAEQLNKKGLGKTIGDMARQASRDVRRNAAEGETQSSSSVLQEVESGLLKALGGATAEVVDIAKDMKPKKKPADAKEANTSKSGAEAKTASASPGATAQSKKSATASFQKKAASWLSKMTTSPTDDTLGSASSGIGGSQGEGGRVLYYSIVLFLLGAVVFLLVRKRVFQVPHHRHGIAGLPHPSEITNSDDVVKAFHTIAANINVETQVWWHHRRAAKVWAAAHPAINNAYATLASLYEQVRYGPDSKPLTAEQLADARRAIQQCQV